MSVQLETVSERTSKNLEIMEIGGGEEHTLHIFRNRTLAPQEVLCPLFKTIMVEELSEGNRNTVEGSKRDSALISRKGEKSLVVLGVRRKGELQSKG